MSKEERERLDRLGNTIASQPNPTEAPLGLAGVALAGGRVESNRASRWTGDGKAWSDLSGGQKGKFMVC